MEHTYIAIDLKSFYASVECQERDLDPMTTNLVVADPSRTEKTICLAVSPSLKKCGIPGRPRLFEVVQKVSEINRKRKSLAPGRKFTGDSYNMEELSGYRVWAELSDGDVFACTVEWIGEEETPDDIDTVIKTLSSCIADYDV